jgi:hypothetical protein
MRAADFVRVVSLLAVLAGTARAADDFVEPTGTITLRDALSAALLHHPELQAFSAEVRAREARALQAGLLPNPRQPVGRRGAATAKVRYESARSASQGCPAHRLFVECDGERNKPAPSRSCRRSAGCRWSSPITGSAGSATASASLAAEPDLTTPRA